MANRTLKRSHAILIATMLVALAVFNLVRAPREAPKVDTLSSRDAVLQEPIVVEQATGRRSLRGPYAILKMNGTRATIENVCFIWDCRLSPALAALRAGDHVRVWMAGNRIWQLNHDGELLLDYRQALDAYRRSAVRQEWVLGALALGIVATLAWIALRRTARPAAKTTAPLRVSIRVNSRGGLPATSTTVSRHALSGAVLERVREAARRHDRDAVIASLVAAGASDASAALTADAILADPARFGF